MKTTKIDCTLDIILWNPPTFWWKLHCHQNSIKKCPRSSLKTHSIGWNGWKNGGITQCKQWKTQSNQFKWDQVPAEARPTLSNPTASTKTRSNPIEKSPFVSVRWENVRRKKEKEQKMSIDAYQLSIRTSNRSEGRRRRRSTRPDRRRPPSTMDRRGNPRLGVATLLPLLFVCAAGVAHWNAPNATLTTTTTSSSSSPTPPTPPPPTPVDGELTAINRDPIKDELHHLLMIHGLFSRFL